MTQETYLLTFLLITWVSGALTVNLLLLGWRCLSTVLLGFSTFLFSLWAYESYQAIQISQIGMSAAYFKFGSLFLILIPPLLYHISCLIMKRAWPNRVSIMALYILNTAFMNALEVRNILIGRGSYYFLQLTFFSEPVAILYRITFFFTIGFMLIKIFELYGKSTGPMKNRVHYLMFSLPLFIYGFTGVPGFSSLLFGMESNVSALFILPIFIAVITYAANFQHLVAASHAIARLLSFAALVLMFLLANELLAQFLAQQFGITSAAQPWAQILINAFAFGIFLIIYHTFQDLRNRNIRNQYRGNQTLILDVANRVLSAHTLNDSVTTAVEFLMEKLELNEGAFLLKNLQTGNFSILYSSGVEIEKLRNFAFGKSLIEWLQKKREPFILSKAEQTMLPSSFQKMTYSLRELPFEVCHPLFLKNHEISGVLLLGHKKNSGPFHIKDSDLLFVVGTILQTVIEHHQLSDQAVVDGLTRLYHQKFFKTQLEERLRFSREQRSSMALIMLDIDYFKKLNDTYGHQAGDKVLESVAKALKETVRANDILARYGGEEFALFIDENPSQITPDNRKDQNENLFHAAERLAEKIRAKIEKHSVIFNDHLFQVTISVGVGFKSEKEITLSTQELIERADKALYTAKQMGRNRVVLATKEEVRGSSLEKHKSLSKTGLQGKRLSESDRSFSF